MLRNNLANYDYLNYKKSRLNKQKGLLSLFLLTSFVLGPIYSLSGMSLDLSYLSIIAIVTLLYFLKTQFQKKPKATLSSYFYIYYFFSMLISSAVIERGAFMFEIDEQGSYNGTFWTILFYFLLGFSSINYGFSLHSKVSKYPILQARYSAKAEKLVTVLFLTLTFLVSALILYKYSSPILLGVERFTFWNTIVPPSLQIAKSLITQAFYFVPALMIVTSSKWRKVLTLLAIFIWIAITLFVLGEKFTAFQYYIAIAAFYFAALGTHSKKLKIPYKTITIVSFILISILAYVYNATGYSVEFIYSRIALQSQLTWITIQNSIEVNSIWTGASELTMTVLPGDRFDRYADAGVGLTGFFPAVQIAALGYFFSSILHIFIFVVAGFIQAEILKLLSNKCIVQSFLLFKLYISIIFFWLALDSAQLYNGVNLICLGLLLAGIVMQKFSHTRMPSHT